MNQVAIQVRLLGEPGLIHGGAELAVAPACLRLLAFVLTRPGRRASKSQLLAALGDAVPDRTARHRLNTAVWRLRSTLESAGVCRDAILVSTPSGLAIAPDCKLEVDCVMFEQACHVPVAVTAWSADHAARVARGLEVYLGEFLEGADDEWALAERGRLAEIHVSALLRMAQWHDAAGNVGEALQFTERAAATEPLREDLQRLLMRQYRRAGIPEMAAQHYESVRALLWAELGVEPLPETRKAGLGRATTEGGHESTSAAAVRDALAELERTRDQLRFITSHVERSMNALRIGLAEGYRRR